MVSPQEWLKTYDHLGSFYPYYCEDHMDRLYTSIGSALNRLPVEQKKIDPVALSEFVTKSYLLGNRTVVQNIRRTPWLAKPASQGNWEYSPVPEHGFQQMPYDEVAFQLKQHLLSEALEYLEGKSRVGILLSGGMDSRILAGVIRELQLNGDYQGDVIALTWGIDGTRDVKYAQQIAGLFSWEWIHCELNAEVLYHNFFIAAEMGAEFAPYHLHAMPKVAAYQELNAVLAGSYGDSVGRAEFSGVHLSNLKPILSTLDGFWLKRRYFGVIQRKVFSEAKDGMLQDAYDYRGKMKLTAQSHNFNEIEQEMHYMRRKLQTPMSFIGQRIPVYQLFTSPKTYGLMWSLDPKMRNDLVYAELIRILPGHLDSIPWARTGQIYGLKPGRADPSPKEHHQYGIWLREDLHDFILSKVLSEPIMKLGVFNESSIRKLVQLWPRSKTISTNAIDELLSWLAVLAIFVEKYEITGASHSEEMRSAADVFDSIRGTTVAWIYQTLREKNRA